MPSQLTNYRIFLASPSDLSDDRTIVEETINELNLTFGRPKGIHLDLIKWETHSAPGISKKSVQKLINNDIGDYDLFIGLLWTRYGTPTDEYQSGTEEEFNIAYEKFQKSSKSVQILFYFKKTPFSIDDIEPDQLKKIKEFKSAIEKDRKVLSGEYNDTFQLSSHLRLHIPIRVQELHENQSSKTVTSKIEPDTVEEIEVDSEVENGLLEYREIYDDSIEIVIQSLNRISDAMEWVSDELNSKTNELTALTLDKSRPLNRRSIKQILARAARSMDHFGNRIDVETPIFFESFQSAMDSLQNILIIYTSDFDEIDMNEVIQTRDSLSDLIESMSSSVGGIDEFISTVRSFPRISKDMNASKTKVESSLMELLDNTKISLSIASGLRGRYDDFLGETNV
ncbi:DUF4062 domain-containing protein [Flagellimonas allohymeniacidonis]|uniref:DUF4062 domain-containing protein n=1 Tax=Flagellimonas allohymeniacidonis TaxID=2517819 RepID=A0A4Q8QBR6_9FLAO|nr:DUF4062 domain-containing protein [Allomuricauda hymeniacidonis]TAI47795.1 DUF4062 domain-containing protein [Allomuricauda hymeniacidonis]